MDIIIKSVNFKTKVTIEEFIREKVKSMIIVIISSGSM